LYYPEVVGEVENQGDTSSKFTEVPRTFCDDTGKVIYVGSAFTSIVALKKMQRRAL